jgi:hypothetical protein
MDRFGFWRKRVSEQRALVALGVSVAAGGPAALAAPANAQLSPGCSQSGSTVTCTYTSGSNAVAIPAGVSSVLAVADGGRGNSDANIPGGEGASVDGDLSVAGPATLWAVVGGNGNGSGSAANGGVDGGGGASDVRTSQSDLTSRLLVAGGGGGAGLGAYGQTSGPASSGGNAGMPGSDGINVGVEGGAGGGAGTTKAGGAGGAGEQFGGTGCDGSAGTLGVGGTANEIFLSCFAGGGGGGGLFGGGGGGASAEQADVPPAGGSGGGGGGSNLVPPGGSSSVDTKGQPMVQLTYTAP